MTLIHHIRRIPESHRAFVATRLRALKQRLAGEVGEGESASRLRLATWNLKHFGKGGADSAHHRGIEPLLYIAEVIAAFDLVAVQEVNENLDQLDELVTRYLGPEWSYIVTDVTEGGAGNYERLAFLYRTPKVRFEREAGEVVLPEGQKIVGPEEDAPEAHGTIQFARTPFVVAFRAGWFRFKLCTVHIYYGGTGTSDLEQRRREIDRVAGFMAERQKKEERRLEKAREGRGREANYILIGDFNIKSPEHHTMQALLAHGFEVPESIRNVASSLGGAHYYDQIVARIADPRGAFGTGGGAFDVFETVYRDEDAAQYYKIADPEPFEVDSDGDPRDAVQKDRYFKTHYRRNMMSDHKLLWCEVRIDFSDDYLRELAGE